MMDMMYKAHGIGLSSSSTAMSSKLHADDLAASKPYS
jgi:hypothetical protein